MKRHLLLSKPWAPGEQRSVFVDSSPDKVCPKVLTEVVTVTTVRICCDMTPWSGRCLVPQAGVPMVEIAERSP